MSEERRVQSIMQDIADGRSSARKLGYDSSTRSLKALSGYEDPDRVKPMTHQDMNLYGDDKNKLHNDKIITISGEYLENIVNRERTYEVLFRSMDDETVFTLLRSCDIDNAVGGTIHVVNDMESIDSSAVGRVGEKVRVFVGVNGPDIANKDGYMGSAGKWPVRGYVLENDQWQETDVRVVPVRTQLFSRFTGLLETDALSEKRVLIIGLGSGGSVIAIGLAQSGVMQFDLIDHDRLEVGNIARHVAGISQVGRLKTHVMRDLVHEKNPYAVVETSPEKICWDTMESLRGRIKEADLVICATDDRDSKKIVNRLCVQETKPLIVAGAFRRAYGGQVLRVRPGESLCFQCFINSLPQQDRDIEITSIEQAEGLAYTDKPVPVEPGLATDIAPINQMVVKLAIQELLQGSQTTLQSLDEDLVAPLYLWLNRREKETPYAELDPLEYNIDGMSVLRWYGVDISKDSACPECGDFLAQMQDQHGVTVKPEDIEVFS